MMRFPVVLSAPSGVGKTTIARELMKRRGDVGYSVSCTTRHPRATESTGVDYHFLSDAEFISRVNQSEFAEWAVVHGKRYGTLRSEVQCVLDAGRHVLMDIDVQGHASSAPASRVSAGIRPATLRGCPGRPSEGPKHRNRRPAGGAASERPCGTSGRRPLSLCGGQRQPGPCGGYRVGDHRCRERQARTGTRPR